MANRSSENPPDGEALGAFLALFFIGWFIGLPLGAVVELIWYSRMRTSRSPGVALLAPVLVTFVFLSLVGVLHLGGFYLVPSLIFFAPPALAGPLVARMTHDRS